MRTLRAVSAIGLLALSAYAAASFTTMDTGGTSQRIQRSSTRPLPGPDTPRVIERDLEAPRTPAQPNADEIQAPRAPSPEADAFQATGSGTSADFSSSSGTTMAANASSPASFAVRTPCAAPPRPSQALEAWDRPGVAKFMARIDYTGIFIPTDICLKATSARWCWPAVHHFPRSMVPQPKAS